MQCHEIMRALLAELSREKETDRQTAFLLFSLDVSSHLLRVDDEACQLLHHSIVLGDGTFNDVLDGDHADEFPRVLLAHQQMANLKKC